MRRYNLINNSLGWLCFIIAAVTYILTLEPTASFWDCPEFITQAYKLEIGHPPGNPIFMLVARFFVNFAFGDVTKVAYMVNLMSGLLSAGTILLLFWTITHLVKRLTVKDDATEVSLLKMIVIFGSGLCGALMFAWSDTFWFSAVEGEVYAFSSFCTALVFWLILKWENRADNPHSDKYLIFIAYIIGISIAVHLLNLLCIPAIVLVVYYKKWKNTTATGSLVALLISFVIVALILYGLVPGFIEVSQYFELFCVNTLGMSYNMGVLIYAVILVACMIWTIYNLYSQKNPLMIRISVALSILLSGMPFIGNNLLIPVLIMAALLVWLFVTKRLPVRILNIVIISILVIFIGYSSYALLLIRSSAHTPMNQNAPDNVFSLSSYLNREQYGERPLLYGQTLNSQVVYEVDESIGSTKPIITDTKPLYAKAVKDSQDAKDQYVVSGEKKDYMMTPELNMVFPRIYSGAESHPQSYSEWIGGMQGTQVNATDYLSPDGTPYQKSYKVKPTMGENLRFFLVYQLNHMYWRYFMWNFAGRQNDIQGNGEINQGNWITGIPFFDNARLGDQSLLPDDMGRGNAGHNVFYMLPLLMGIIGLLWQAFTSKRGIEQFWVIFFLFFMTGIAIVLYLNQTPGQPRERDYAFAGSFYAFAIWVGMGVAGLWRAICFMLDDRKKDKTKGKTNVPVKEEAYDEPAEGSKAARSSLIAACVACAVGIFVPLQVVSQTWDDHDRSNRYTTRDFGANYLESLDENAIIFTNGDNDTFPLWYAQEVEGKRTDVKVVNLSYLTTDWYIDQVRRPSYNSPGIRMQAKPENYAYDRLQFCYFLPPVDTMRVNAINALQELYSPRGFNESYGVMQMRYPNVYIPVDTAAMVRAGRITSEEARLAGPTIDVDFMNLPIARAERGVRINSLLPIDIIATSAANGWDRPVYFATSVPESYYVGLQPYMRSTGMAYEVGPRLSDSENPGVNTDKMYRNITERFAWGGLDKVTEPGQVYLDETVRRMVTATRSAMLDVATALVNEAVGVEVALHNDSINHTLTDANRAELIQFRDDRYAKARTMVDLLREKLPVAAMPYGLQVGQQLAELYCRLGLATGDRATEQIGLDILRNEIDNYAQNIIYYHSLTPTQYKMLTRADMYIHRYYFMDLIDSYYANGGDVEQLEKDLRQRGVDFNRVLAEREALYRQQGAE